MQNGRSAILIIFLLLHIIINEARAQPGPGNASFSPPDNFLWISNYNKFRMSEKLFWDAQLHF